MSLDAAPQQKTPDSLSMQTEVEIHKAQGHHKIVMFTYSSKPLRVAFEGEAEDNVSNSKQRQEHVFSSATHLENFYPLILLALLFPFTDVI